MDYFYRRRN